MHRTSTRTLFADASTGPAQPLLTRAEDTGNSFTDLLDLAAVDELLSRRGLRTPFLRIAKDGAVVDPKRFTTSGGAGAEIGDQVLLRRRPAAVRRRQHRRPAGPAPAVAAADRVRRLSSPPTSGHPTQVNAYITPPSSRGFSPHYDVHDVFVLQVAGEKHWRIHAPVLPDPLRDQPWQDRAADGRRGRDRRAGDRRGAAPGRRPLPAPRVPALRGGAGRDQRAPDHRRPPGHPLAAAESALDLVRGLAADDPRAARLPAARPRPRRPRVAGRRRRRRARPRCGTGWAGSTPPRSPTGCARAPGRRCGRSRSRRWPSPPPRRRSTDDTVLRLRRRLRCALRDGDGRRGRAARRRGARTVPGRTCATRWPRCCAAGELKVGDLPGLDPADRLALARRLVTESIAIVPDADRRAGSGGGERSVSPWRRPDAARPARPRPLLGPGAASGATPPSRPPRPRTRWLLIEQPGPVGP